MLATVLHGPRDVRYEHVEEPKILKPTDAIIKLSATCVCGSDLWPYRGLQPMEGPAYMGHEYCGVVIEVGSDVKTVKPGQCFWPQLQNTTSPARISFLGPPLHCVQPQPETTIRCWPNGCVCQAERAPGSKVTRAADVRPGPAGSKSGSIRTSPVK